MPSTPVTAPRPAFSIERILGLEQETSRDSKLHRPWAEISPEKENNSSNRCIEPQQHQQHHHHLQRLKSNRPTLNWYIGRRPRTAFTNSQVNVMETVFQMNCYPGIQLREQLADRLDLDEDRIQIWFQNRRAKLRRSFRESRLQLVQTAVADIEKRQKVGGQLTTETNVHSHQQPHAPCLRHEVNERGERC
ncbi:homeobox expressed in ES cells 1 isoform X1 [Nelusetta ayraudi]|uniref:homeobox expressed in ES cells 1 isoform X1 n=1 Tax=Nelusetta ayraudi TaxID=303726 RepID=UPI003F6F9F7F